MRAASEVELKNDMSLNGAGLDPRPPRLTTQNANVAPANSIRPIGSYTPG